MDNLFFYRVTKPVEDAACGEADKPARGGQDSWQCIVKKEQNQSSHTQKGLKENSPTPPTK